MNPKERGFTLLELTISIGVFAILTSMVLANFRSGERQNALNLGAQNVALTFRKAEFWAQSGRTWFTEGREQVPSGGYGVNISECGISPCSMFVFGDLDGDLQFDSPDELIENEDYTLPRDIVIDTILPTTTVDVVFKPPVPNICVNRDCSNTPITSITIRDIKTNETALVEVNQDTGQVNIR